MTTVLYLFSFFLLKSKTRTTSPLFRRPWFFFPSILYTRGHATVTVSRRLWPTARAYLPNRCLPGDRDGTCVGTPAAVSVLRGAHTSLLRGCVLSLAAVTSQLYYRRNTGNPSGRSFPPRFLFGFFRAPYRRITSRIRHTPDEPVRRVPRLLFLRLLTPAPEPKKKKTTRHLFGVL